MLLPSVDVSSRHKDPTERSIGEATSELGLDFFMTELIKGTAWRLTFVYSCLHDTTYM